MASGTSTFLKTTREIERSESWSRFLFPILALAILTGWSLWFFGARVSVYEITSESRVEVVTASHPVEAEVAGRVLKANLVLGRPVRAGEVLVELDSEQERLQLSEQLVRRAAFEREIETLKKESSVEKNALAAATKAGKKAVKEAESKYEEASAMAQFAEKAASRKDGLDKKGAMSTLEVEEAHAQANRSRAAATGARLSVDRLDWEHRTQNTDRRAHISSLSSDLAHLTGELETIKAAISKLEHNISRRQIQAPVDGTLGEVSVIRAGAFVQKDEKLAVVVPGGTLKIVSHFAPPAALGRIRPGQPARMRMHGFPWAQYGMLSAEVERVGGEVRNGTVRVDLKIDAENNPRIPLQHGLPGTLEVEVENVAPSTLAIRAAGKLIDLPVDEENTNENGVHETQEK